MYLQLLLLSGKWGLPKSRVLQHCLSRPSPELSLDHNKKAIEAPQRVNGVIQILPGISAQIGAAQINAIAAGIHPKAIGLRKRIRL